VRNHVDLPRLEAMNRQWRDFPPLQVQMRRLAMYFGLQKDEVVAASPTESQEEQNLQLTEMFEFRPMPKIMSQEEYLAQRGLRGDQDGR
jgi:hypothetical protein